jgi:hypothetical protein
MVGCLGGFGFLASFVESMWNCDQAGAEQAEALVLIKYNEGSQPAAISPARFSIRN